MYSDLVCSPIRSAVLLWFALKTCRARDRRSIPPPWPLKGGGRGRDTVLQVVRKWILGRFACFRYSGDQRSMLLRFVRAVTRNLSPLGSRARLVAIASEQERIDFRGRMISGLVQCSNALPISTPISTIFYGKLKFPRTKTKARYRSN